MKRGFVFVALAYVSVSCLNNSTLTNQVDQFQKDTTAIRTYLVQNGISATKLSQGVWFVIDSVAAGIRGVYKDSIMVTYQMKRVPDASVLDQSSNPTTLILSNLVYGIQLAMPQFQKGSKGRIFIPSFYGYQNSSVGSVGPNTNLIFDFKLISVSDYQLRQDTAAIGSYLAGKGIKPKIDPSGLRYTVDTLRNGPTPVIADSVIIKYTTKLLSGVQVDQSASGVKVLLTDTPIALQAGLIRIQEGSWVTLYSPSSLAYGPAGNSTISVSSNTNIIYNIQLVKVIHH